MCKIVRVCAFILFLSSNDVYGRIHHKLQHTDLELKGKQLIQNVQREMKRNPSQNFHDALDDIENHLVSACSEKNKICGENISDRVKVNSATFSKRMHLLDEILESRKLQNSDSDEDVEENSADVITGMATLVTTGILVSLQVFFLLILLPFTTAGQIMTIILEGFGAEVIPPEDEEDDKKLTNGLVSMVMESMETWSTIIDAETEDVAPEGVNNDNRKRQLRHVLATEKFTQTAVLTKAEKLSAVVQFAGYGYVAGGGDVLTSVQYSSAAYAYFSNN